MTSPGNKIDSQINALTVQEPRTEVNLNQFWEQGTVLIKILRRFGCPLCRYEAKLISDLKPEFDRIGVKLIAIGFDEIGLEEWTESNVWLGDLFMDPERKIYQKFELPSFTQEKTLEELKNPLNIAVYKKALEANVGGNMNKGDGKQQGATYLIGKGGEILYEFRQTTYGAYPDLKEILKICGGNPDVVKDDTQAPACDAPTKL